MSSVKQAMQEAHNLRRAVPSEGKKRVGWNKVNEYECLGSVQLKMG